MNLKKLTDLELCELAVSKLEWAHREFREHGAEPLSWDISPWPLLQELLERFNETQHLKENA